MRKGFRGAIFFLLFSLVLWGGVVPIFAAGSSLKVRMYNGNTAAVINTIFPWYRLTNTGSTAIDLSKVKIRYYYTIDGEKPQNFWCDWSTIGAANVTGTFGKLNPAFAGADSYFELGFKPGAGFLKPGRSIEAQNRIAKTDWTNYNQRNDYSFNASAKTYVDWNKIRVTIESDVPVTSHDYTHNGEWVNQPVTIHLTVAGGGAGVTTYYKIDNGPNQSGKTIAITENGTHTVSFWSVNGSGNSETPQSLIVKLDQTKPALVAALDPSANAAGWNNSDTTITYTATDNVSGIKSVTAPVTVSSEGANQTYQGTAVDIAGNTTNVSVTVNLDKTLPVISDLQPAASTTVTTKKPLISAVLSDSLSGIDSATLGLTLDGKTVVGTYDATTGKVTYIPSTDLSVGSHTFSVTGTDLAGNKATVAGSTFTVKGVVPVTSHNYLYDGKWVNQPVTINLTVTGGTGVTTYYQIDEGSVRTGNTIFITTEGIHTVSFWSVTASGTSETAQTLTVKLDQTKSALVATLNPSANVAGWNNSDTTITYTATDSVSGVKSVTAPVTVSTEGANQIYSGTAIDNAGNITNVSVTVNLDKTLPVISDLQPAASATVTTQKPTFSARLSDNLSGVDPAAIILTLDGTIVTGTYDATSGKVTYIPGTDLSLGSHTFAVAVVDLAGNQAATDSIQFEVAPPEVAILDVNPIYNPITSELSVGTMLENRGADTELWVLVSVIDPAGKVNGVLKGEVIAAGHSEVYLIPEEWIFRLHTEPVKLKLEVYAENENGVLLATQDFDLNLNL